MLLRPCSSEFLIYIQRISLRWMIREVFKANTGIMFNSESLRDIGLDPTTLYPFVTPRPPRLPVGSAHIESRPLPPSKLRRIASHITSKLRKRLDPEAGRVVTKPLEVTVGTEEEEDLKDALSPVYDQLGIHPLWWILEVMLHYLSNGST